MTQEKKSKVENGQCGKKKLRGKDSKSNNKTKSLSANQGHKPTQTNRKRPICKLPPKLEDRSKSRPKKFGPNPQQSTKRKRGKDCKRQ
jgi:hypothetical protein